MINALVATEDARFFEHRGLDLRALARVFFKTLLMRDQSSGGGSTLSQQLAKNLYPRKKHKRGTIIINKSLAYHHFSSARTSSRPRSRTSSRSKS